MSDFQPVLKVFNLIPGKYTFHLTVTDTKGKVASDSVDVFVKKGISLISCCKPFNLLNLVLSEYQRYLF